MSEVLTTEMLSKGSPEPMWFCFLQACRKILISSLLVNGSRENVSPLESWSTITAVHWSYDAHCRAPELHLTTSVLHSVLALLSLGKRWLVGALGFCHHYIPWHTLIQH